MIRTILLIALGFVASAQGQIDIGGGHIDVSFDQALSSSQRAMTLDWIKTAAGAVINYYGRFPVRHLRLGIEVVEGDRIESGRTFGSRDGGTISVSVGRETTQAHFDRDWLMTHEMVHLGLPSLPERNHWLEEGAATYVEPIARVRSGHLRAEQVWSELARDLPQGLPEAGDRGLDHTHTWGRTYWGGALFCLLADVEIRQRTKNAKGLIDALRGILEAGGSISQDWGMERLLQTGDRATGVPVLEELYLKMRAQPGSVNLEQLWKQLGIERRGRSVVFNDKAPLASVRKAIMPEGSRE